METGLAAFFESQEQTDLQKRSVIAAQDAGKAAKELVPARAVFGANGTTAQVVLLNLVQQQSLLAQAKGNIAQGLIQTYLALGGGWEIRCQPQDNGPLGPLVPPPATISPKNEAGPEEAVPPPPPTEKKAAPAPRNQTSLPNRTESPLTKGAKCLAVVQERVAGARPNSPK